MSEPIAVRGVSDDDFDIEAIEASHSVPVLVDFWADWCQPCRMLAPLLEQLASEYGDRLRIVKVNTDEHPALASRFGIRSLPTIKLLRLGEVVDEFSGVRPLAELQAFIEPHLPCASDGTLQKALDLAAAGDRDRAIELLQEAVADEPDNYRLHPELVRLLLGTGRVDEADRVLGSLPANIQQQDDMLKLYALSGFARVAAEADNPEDLEKNVAANPDDREARYRLSAVRVMEGDYEEAMDNLLAILRRDRGYRDDAARRALVDIFTLLDNRGELVKKYRRLLASAIN